MARQPLTALGRKGHGQQVSNTTECAVKYAHDILLLAAKKGMDVWITCGSLRTQLRDRYTREVTGVTFGQSVREVIDSGRNVSILLWNDPAADQPFAPSLAALLVDLRVPSEHVRGKLSIRATGSTDGWRRVTHFVAATDASRQMWYLRVEAPHEPLTGEDLLQDQRPRLAAAALFATPDARRLGSELVSSFQRAFSAAGRRAAQQDAAGFYYATSV